MKKPTYIFASIVAQPDNLGDIAIRKEALDWLSGSKNALMIYVGKMDDSYIEAFTLCAGTRVFRSQIRFQCHLVRSAISAKVVLLFAPGPQLLSNKWPKVLKSVINLVNSGVVKWSGGSVVVLGRAYEGNGKVMRFLEQKLLRLTDLAVVRDEVSSGAIGMQVRFEPDLAFVSRGTRDLDMRRNVLALCLRDDANVRIEDLGTVIMSARELGLEPVFVTQVRRDNNQHARLGRAFGAEVVSWTTESHAEQMERVAKVYDRSAIVYGDRLHGLIFGARAGAVPVGRNGKATKKLVSSLQPILDLQMLEADADKATVSKTIINAADSAVKTSARIMAVRARLDILKSEVSSVYNK